MTDTTTESGPLRQDGLTIEGTDVRFSGKSGVTDGDVKSLQLEREAVLIVRGVVATVGTKIAKGEVVRVPVFKISEGRVIHDPALRTRLLIQLGFEDSGGVIGNGPTAPAVEDRDEDARVPEASEQQPLFDDGVGHLDEPPIRPVSASAGSTGDWEVRDLDGPDTSLGGERVGSIPVKDAKLAAFLEEL